MSDSERRTETRVEEEATIFLELMSEDDSGSEPTIIICHSVDLSANGIQVQIDMKVPIGSILRLVVDLDQESDPIYLVGEVRWVSEKDDHYFVGFELYDAENTNIIGWKNIIANLLDQQHD